jgi:hypothetical protein
MRKFPLAFLFLLLLAACSPRDFLTRRLAADLIAASATFRTPQQFLLRTGTVSNDDHLSPDSIALQHHGWITATHIPCPPSTEPPPCWDLTLTPAGIDTLQTLLPPADTQNKSFNILAARRELVAVTGISSQGTTAEVEFTWRWNPLNEIGAAIYHSDLRYRSTAAFRHYDDGWRIVRGTPHPAQSLDDALKNAEPVQ